MPSGPFPEPASSVRTPAPIPPGAGQLQPSVPSDRSRLADASSNFIEARVTAATGESGPERPWEV